MENFLSVISSLPFIIAVAVIILLIIIWLVVRKTEKDKFKKQLQDYEVRYNQIKSIPLSFKLNKSIAIARIDQEKLNDITLLKEDFDRANSNLKQIASSIAETEDEISSGKLKKSKKLLLDLDSQLTLGEDQVSKLNQSLDLILEKENAKRSEVNTLKEQFRNIKANAYDNSNSLSYSFNTIEKSIANIENMFSSFEEWMYASDYEKANNELDNIKSSISNLDNIVTNLPSLLEDARGYIPELSETINKKAAELSSKNVYLNHLSINDNISAINKSLNADLESLKNADGLNVREHLDSYKERLNQLLEALDSEEKSSEELRHLAKDSKILIKDAKENAVYVKEQYDKSSVRFGLEGLDSKIKENEEKLNDLDFKQEKVFENIASNNYPATSVINALEQLYNEISETNKEFKEMKLKIDSAQGDEDRAKKQLLKLQLIMNEMQVKIRKHRLPTISSKYQQDLLQGFEYINSIGKLIDTTPLDVELLNVTLKDAIDFIYKLYDQVNNIVGMAIMVENTIVFGNKYRSNYGDIDSDLTRAELAFRNGEYTQALMTSIATIDKIQPGSYEKLVKDYAKNAA